MQIIFSKNVWRKIGFDAWNIRTKMFECNILIMLFHLDIMNLVEKCPTIGDTTNTAPGQFKIKTKN